MLERDQGQAGPTRRRPEESRGGWAWFGRLLLWSTRNNGLEG